MRTLRRVLERKTKVVEAQWNDVLAISYSHGLVVI